MTTISKWSITCEFSCPKCSSSYFRSANISLPRDEWTGCCKKCPFTWIRGEDWKYFESVKRARFGSKEEFDSRKVK